MRMLEVDDPRWSDFVESRAAASIFHHPSWTRLIADCYGYRARVAAVTDAGGAVTAGLPVIDVTLPFGRRRWVSLPFTDHCPPLSDGDPDDLAGRLRELTRAANVDLLEIRAPLASGPAVQSDAPFVRHDVALSPDSGAAWKRLRRNHRRSVVDAQEAGLRVESGRSAADIETFYRLHLQTRRRLGVPIQPRRFFRLLQERIIEPGLGFVLTAYLGDAPAAAAVFCSWNGTLVCKYSARADRFAKLDAIHLLFWTAMRWGSENGFHTFDLGRSGVEQAQLRGFKTGWGAREEPLSYSRIGTAPWRSGSTRSSAAMGIVIRNSAPWICRAVGEIFYRYAA